MKRATRSSVDREEIRAERDMASKLETMLHAELSGTADGFVLEPPASRPDWRSPFAATNLVRDEPAEYKRTKRTRRSVVDKGLVRGACSATL